ncbi:cytochrome P450 4F5-like [Ptychodera flava]|uniref:cytochrome P450 4F5-like n=1 Tax=Ptychodera flava TaxID=63121 RepID=UPI00396A8876
MNVGNEEGIQLRQGLTHKHSHYYVQCFPARSALNVVHPDTIKTIASTAEPKNPSAFAVIREWIGDGLLASTGAKWKRNRRLLTPVFHFDMLTPYVKVYNQCVHIMLNKWKDCNETEAIEVFENISLLTLDVILKCLFSMESNCQLQGEENDYIIGVRRIALQIQIRLRDIFEFLFGKTYFLYLSSDGRKWTETLDLLHGYSRVLINHKKKMRTTKQIPGHAEYRDFLDTLLDARDEDGKGLTDQEIQDEVDTFMFEGHDTTASGISWFLYNLARHPEYQQRCREEIDGILDKKGKDELDWNDMNKIPYLTMCLKESLRIHSPVPVTSRRLRHTYQFSDGKIVHPGTIVFFAIGSLHRNPHVWENPDVYDPMRFSTENSKNRHSYAFMPFSAGPRNCIGQRFAMDEMKVVAGMILRYFELSVEGCTTPRRQLGMVLRAENGIHIKFKPRKRDTMPKSDQNDAEMS